MIDRKKLLLFYIKVTGTLALHMEVGWEKGEGGKKKHGVRRGGYELPVEFLGSIRFIVKHE